MRSRSIGAGYVGLTTAACLAHLGHRVVCADIDEERVAALSKGEVPILEEGLPALVAEGLQSRRLRFVVGAPDAARDAEFVFLCVQTPQSDDGAADLSASRAVAREIAPVLRPGHRRGQQVDDAGRLDRCASPRALKRRAPHRRRASRRTPSSSARARGPRLPPPHRVVIGCDDAAVAVRVSRALPRRPGADPRHRPRVGRDDQVRVERVPRHEDLVRQRDRQPLRGGRRRRARGRARHGLRPAHRLRVPAPRPGLRRLVLPEGHRRAPPHRRRRRATTSACCAASSR